MIMDSSFVLPSYQSFLPYLVEVELWLDEWAEPDVGAEEGQKSCVIRLHHTRAVSETGNIS